MSSGISLIRIQKELKELCEAHGQVRTYRDGLFLDVIKESAIEYTLAHSYIRQAPTTNNSTGYLIEFSVMAKVNKKTDANNDYVRSNTLEIWKDIFNVIQYSERWQAFGVVDGTVIPQLFESKGLDRVTGWGGNIPFIIEGDLGFCDVPIFGYDYGEVAVGSGGACDPVLIVNSDLTYQQSATSGTTFDLPDISNTDSDGSTVILPAQTPMVCTPGHVPVGIAYDRPEYDGWRETFELYDSKWQLDNGTYEYTPPEHPVSYAELDLDATYPFHTMKADNAFGNRARFTDTNGGYYPNPWINATVDKDGITQGTQFSVNYMIDHLTGLGWDWNEISASNWMNALTEGNGRTGADGSTDYRLCSVPEILSIACWDVEEIGPGSGVSGLEYYPIDKGGAETWWTATTNDRGSDSVSTDSAAIYAQLPLNVTNISININRKIKTLTDGVGITVRTHYT
jgi:hypothetical protein